MPDAPAPAKKSTLAGERVTERRRAAVEAAQAEGILPTPDQLACRSDRVRHGVTVHTTECDAQMFPIASRTAPPTPAEQCTATNFFDRCAHPDGHDGQHEYPAPAVIEVHHHDIEKHAEHFNEGWDEAHRQGIGGAESRDWLIGKVKPILAAAVGLDHAKVAADIADAVLSEVDLADDTPTPAGDDREALVVVAEAIGDALARFRLGAAPRGVSVDMWLARAALAARPSAPTVTTEQVQAARARADLSMDINWADPEQRWCVALLAALGIEVSP